MHIYIYIILYSVSIRPHVFLRIAKPQTATLYIIEYTMYTHIYSIQNYVYTHI